MAPESSAALAEAFIDLLGDRERRLAIGRRAYEYSRDMVWSSVGAEYNRIFARAALSVPPTVPPLARPISRPVARLAAVGG